MLAGEGGVNEYRGIALEGHNNPDSKILNNTITNSGYCAISTGGGANVLIKNNGLSVSIQLTSFWRIGPFETIFAAHAGN